MKRPHNTSHRGHGRRRRAKSTAARAAKAPSKPVRPTRHSEMFGDIPLIPFAWVDERGGRHETLQYDPDYRPPMPAGAVRGDVREQVFCQMCHVPQYFFVDLPRVCVQCGESFVFSGAEQKLWYEKLKFHFASTATRCLACRRKRRSDRALIEQLSAAKVQAAKNPDDATAQLALAEAIVRQVQRTGRGAIAEAIAAARRARRLLRSHPTHDARETFFWEGLAHAAAGRGDTARELLERFLGPGLAGRLHATLAKEARAWIDAEDVRQASESPVV